MLKLAGPEASRGQKGRGEEPQWKKVQLAHDRSSPVKGIQVPADMGRAERAVDCLLKVVDKLKARRFDALGRQSLVIWMHSRHETVASLSAVLGAAPFHRLLAQLWQLLRWTDKLRSTWPVGLDHRLQAMAKQVASKRKIANSDDQRTWLASLVESGDRLAHRLVGREPIHMGQAASGDLSEADHLKDVEEEFRKRWLADDPAAAKEFAEVFKELRRRLGEARASGDSPSLAELEERFSCDAVRAVLRRFKTNTSTGVCNAELKWLSKAPDSVLASLGALLAKVAWAAVGSASGAWHYHKF